MSVEKVLKHKRNKISVFEFNILHVTSEKIMKNAQDSKFGKSLP